LFIAFLKVSLASFGGGLVWAAVCAVEQNHWLKDEEFARHLKPLPVHARANVVGIAVCVGAEVRD